MTDEIKLHQDMNRAAQAKALLDNELLNEAFKSLEAQYLDFWQRNTSADAVNERERLWQAVQILGKVQTHLNTIVANGKVADHELRDLAQGGRS